MVVYVILLAVTLVAALLIAAFANERKKVTSLRLTVTDLANRLSQPPADRGVTREHHENVTRVLLDERETWKNKAMANANEMGAAQQRLMEQLEQLAASRGFPLTNEAMKDLEAQRARLASMRVDVSTTAMTAFEKRADGLWHPLPPKSAPAPSPNPAPVA